LASSALSAPRDLLQGGFAAFVVEFPESIKAVAAVAHDPARLRDIAELLGQLQQSYFRPNYFLFRRHRPRFPFSGAEDFNCYCQIKSRFLHVSIPVPSYLAALGMRAM
jgi:hypothetical protein